jgi:cellulose synthase/poly-beta-1,6-N-acetylglucosamine synthase-like glycosyltransferase
MSGLEVLFWTAATTVAYTYAGYPLALRLLGLARRPRPDGPAAWPRLSVVISAYNEAACIAGKLRSALEQDYPTDRLEVIVVSDGSEDGTDEIVRACPDPRVRLIRQEPRAGKSLALNRGVAAARGDVLVFTDANADFAPGALARLAAPFADPAVGLVSGQGLYARTEGGHTRAVGNGYVRYEAAVKSAESRLGFVAGADGAIYALRRTIYRDLAAAHVNDLLHPIQAALAGYRARFEPRAITVEPPSKHAGQEWGRHVRMVAQSVHLVSHWLPRLLAARRWREAWGLVSHRALRWLTAPALGLILALNWGLTDHRPLYDVTLAAQAAFYALAALGYVADRTRLGLGPLAVPYYFCVVAAAGVAGVVRWLRGGAQAVWAPTSQVTAEDPTP